jgi:hypothetical protein
MESWMPLFWFLAGVLTTLVGLILLLPWLRGKPRFNSLPAIPWQISVAGVALVAAIFALHGWLERSDAVVPNTGPLSAMNSSAGAFVDASKMFNGTTTANTVATTANTVESSPPKTGAESMERAVAQLEARLAQTGGTADDWELLAKSFDFLGRPEDARLARARQLPALTAGAATPVSTNAAPAGAAPAGASVSGEISLADALSAKAAAGETLFIVAKSVDSPGAPVAVYRAKVGTWPVNFTLDDSQSMLAGRNLSSAGRVTIEARISKKGQALPAAGDLQGSSGVINPADHQPLKILIDRIIT